MSFCDAGLVQGDVGQNSEKPVHLLIEKKFKKVCGADNEAPFSFILISLSANDQPILAVERLLQCHESVLTYHVADQPIGCAVELLQAHGPVGQVVVGCRVKCDAGQSQRGANTFHAGGLL